MEEKLTFCAICASHSSARATVKNGKIVKWVRDESGVAPSEPCRLFKGRFNGEILSHPDRLKYPLKRVGERGEGKWERISWDEALNTIAQKLTEIKEKYGSKSLGLALGEPKGLEWAVAHRFAGAFGTSNIATPSHL
jgi:anaerobic selenocysteine-containing dehydrogenase